MTYKAANFASTVLAVGLGGTVGDTTLQIQATDIPKFPVINDGGGAPAEFTMAVLTDSARRREIVRMTRHDTGAASFTIVRGQEGTVPLVWQPGDSVSIRLTAGVVNQTYTHPSQSTGAHAATAIAVTPAGGIASTNVQAALQELDGEKSAVGHGHNAAEISFAPAGGLAATTVQAALQELDSEKQPAGTYLVPGDIGSSVQGFDPATAKTNQAQTYTAATRGAIATLADAATITPNFAQANMFRVQLGGNRTLANPTNLVEGQSGSIDIHQDNTGGRTLAFGWGWDFPGGVAPTLSTAVRAKDKLGYQVDVARSAVVTISIATPGVITWANHGLLAGQQVRLSTTGALPTGLAPATTYFVVPVDANSFQLAATRTGAALATSGTQSGAHTMEAVSITANLLNGVN